MTDLELIKSVEKFLESDELEKHFAKVRARVQKAVDASPKSVTFEDAKKQVESFKFMP